MLMDRRGVSGKAIAAVVIILIIIAGLFYFVSQSDNDSVDSGSDSGAETGNAEIDDFGDALDSSELDSDLGLEEDFDYNIE